MDPDLHNYDHHLTKLLKAGYILELVFVFALALKLVPGYYLALSERVHCNRSFYSIYWGTAFIVSLINLCLLITHLSIGWLFLILSPVVLDTMLYGIYIYSSSITLVLLSLVVAILAVCTSNRHTRLNMPIPIKAADILCCCCCCTCCSRSTKSKVFQTFILWNILIFVHIVVTSTISLCLLIIIYPAQALSIIASVYSAMFCFIMLTAHLFYSGTQRSSWYQMFLNMMLTVLFPGFVSILIVLYISCLNKGLHTKGVGGFLVSLLPSLFLSVIGWYVKRRFLKPDGNSDAETDLPNESNAASDTKNNSDVGDIEQMIIHPSAQTASVSSSEHTPLIQHN